jgi:thiamine transport system ATP-binding protein
VLALEEIAFAYPAGPAYRLSMRAAPAEVTAVSGASGSGKSTLLDLIAGFLAPQAGALTLDGSDLLPLPPERRPVSILFQADNLFEHLSAAANLALALPRGTARVDRAARIGPALEEVGLEGFGHRRAASLSGGEKQRVALARTLLLDRPVLLLDEPFSALDDAARAMARDLVLRLTRSRGWHTVLVTHYQEDVDAVAARRYRLESGVLLLG